MLTVTDGAKTLGISVAATWKLVYAGRIPFVRIGRSVRLRDEDLQAFIQSNLTRHKRGMDGKA
jgi:excisionase family DNA binding protein